MLHKQSAAREDQGVGLKELWPHLLAGQFVLQSLVLALLLVSIARRGGVPRMRPIVLKVLAITLSTVLIELLLTWRIGWLILVPILGVTVLVLMNASWTALWTSCLAVAACGAFFAALTLDFGEFTVTRQLERKAARAARKKRVVARYQQVAGELDHIGPKRRSSPEPPPSPAAPPPAPPIAAAAPPSPAAVPETVARQQPTPSLNLESRIPLADRVLPNALDEEDPTTTQSEVDWLVARSHVHYRGRVNSDEGEQVLHINGRLYAQHDVLSIIRHGVVYRWFIVRGDAFALDLKRLNTKTAPPAK
jgi:hypothetical protein